MTEIVYYIIAQFMKTIVITSWYFNPIHPWHIECMEMCAQLWDELWAIINSDHQARLKTGQTELYQDQEFRMSIVSSLKAVDRVMLSVDQDGSVCESIRTIANMIRSEYWPDTQIIFGKGGDRFAGNIPEVQVCQEYAIQIRDGLGSKTHNSSEYRAKRV